MESMIAAESKENATLHFSFPSNDRLHPSRDHLRPWLNQNGPPLSRIIKPENGHRRFQTIMLDFSPQKRRVYMRWMR